MSFVTTEGKTLHCPQCGVELGDNDFHEGVCEGCCIQNQLELDRHNNEFGRWISLSDGARSAEIKEVMK